MEKILYSAVVLNDLSRIKLYDLFKHLIPNNFEFICHHMTIAFGKPVPNSKDLGKEVTLTVTKLGISDMVIAVGVTGYDSLNEIPHITVAINPDGGKPVMSNHITDWKPVKPFDVTGIVTNIKK